MTNQAIYLVGSFIAGFVLMAFEILSSRIIAPLIGNSIYSWASVIGVILFGLSLGAWAGGMLADSKKTKEYLRGMLLLSSLLIAVVPIVAHYLEYTFIPSSIIVTSLFYALVLFFPASCAVGTIQPLLLKVYATTPEKLGHSYGLLSMLWSCGSILGVMLTGFFFISIMSISTIIIMLAVICFLYSLVFISKEKPVLIKYAVSFITICILVIFVLDTKKQSDAVTVYTKDTPYYRIKITDFSYTSFGFARSLFLDYDQHSQETSKVLPFAYTNSFPIFGKLFPNPKNILVLGGGAYTLPKGLSTYYKTNVDVFEIDPILPSVVKTYFGYSTSSITTTVGDARVLLSRSDKEYDLIFGDVYNSFISIPYHTATREYYQITKDHLVPGGIYAMSFASPETGDGQKFLSDMIATFSSIYPNYYIFSFTNNPHSLGSILLVGINAPLTKHIKEEDLRKQLAGLGQYSFLADFLREKDSFLVPEPILFTDDYIPIENEMRPILSQYFAYYSSFMKSLHHQKRSVEGKVVGDKLIFEEY